MTSSYNPADPTTSKRTDAGSRTWDRPGHHLPDTSPARSTALDNRNWYECDDTILRPPRRFGVATRSNPRCTDLRKTAPGRVAQTPDTSGDASTSRADTSPVQRYYRYDLVQTESDRTFRAFDCQTRTEIRLHRYDRPGRLSSKARPPGITSSTAPHSSSSASSSSSSSSRGSSSTSMMPQPARGPASPVGCVSRSSSS